MDATKTPKTRGEAKWAEILADPCYFSDDPDARAAVVAALIFGGPTAEAMLSDLGRRGLAVWPGELWLCRRERVALLAVEVMDSAGLAEAASDPSNRWSVLASETIARREAAELHKAAKQPKKPASPLRGRL